MLRHVLMVKEAESASWWLKKTEPSRGLASRHPSYRCPVSRYSTGLSLYLRYSYVILNVMAC